MMYCRVCFDRDGSFNSKTVQVMCTNEKTGVQFKAWICEGCQSLGYETRLLAGRSLK
ncbi:hypothetical protein AfiDRAFT_1546 [Afipia sp. 1NLS2]|nr:hypothetical protein AfiDRAFT_1546 [Afipia sp. 1NLS2]